MIVFRGKTFKLNKTWRYLTHKNPSLPLLILFEVIWFNTLKFFVNDWTRQILLYSHLKYLNTVLSLLEGQLWITTQKTHAEKETALFLPQPMLHTGSANSARGLQVKPAPERWQKSLSPIFFKLLLRYHKKPVRKISGCCYAKNVILYNNITFQ